MYSLKLNFNKNFNKFMKIINLCNFVFNEKYKENIHEKKIEEYLNDNSTVNFLKKYCFIFNIYIFF